MKKLLSKLILKPLLFNENNKVENVKKRNEQEINQETEDGSYVYHVANPDIRGVVLQSINENICEVNFDEPVSFSGNPNA